MIRTFEVCRQADESGISGTGVVCEGTIFSDGVCIVRWVSQEGPSHSTSIFDSFGSFMAIHISPHPDNKTEVKFNDGTEYLHNTKVKKTRRRKEPVANGK